MQSDKEKRAVLEDGISVNCATLLDGGVLRWLPEEEVDAQTHQIACVRRGESISVSEFATPFFHPFIDVDLEKRDEPDGDDIGVYVAQNAQRELAKFLALDALGSDSRRRSEQSVDYLKAVILSAPPKLIADTPKKVYKRGFHVVFPNVVVSLKEWRHFLAAVAHSCHNDQLHKRDRSTCSDWLKSIDIACGPNLRAPFSDKKARCLKCNAKRFGHSQPDGSDLISIVAQPCRKRGRKAGPEEASEGRGRTRDTAYLHDAAQQQVLEDVDTKTLTTRGDEQSKQMIKMLKQVRTPEGRNRNSCSVCEDAQCVDGYIPENRPYTIMAVLSGSGRVNAVETQRAKAGGPTLFAYQLATIRAPSAQRTHPPFTLYEGMVSVCDVLKMAGKDSAHVRGVNANATGTNKDAFVRRGTGRVYIRDENYVLYALNIAQKLHPCFSSVLPDKAWTNKTRSYVVLCVTGEDSRRCLNLETGRMEIQANSDHVATADRQKLRDLKSSSLYRKDALGFAKKMPGMHRSGNKAYFYFCADTGTVCQKCRCMCLTHEGRVTTQYCKDFKSEKVKLTADQHTRLFGVASGRVAESPAQVAAKFQLTATSCAVDSLKRIVSYDSRFQVQKALAETYAKNKTCMRPLASPHHSDSARSSVSFATEDDDSVSFPRNASCNTLSMGCSLDMDSSASTNPEIYAPPEAAPPETAVEEFSASIPKEPAGASSPAVIPNYLDLILLQQQQTLK